MRLRAGLCILLLSCVAALAAGCGGKSEEPEEFRIGLLAPLTQQAHYTAHLAIIQRVRELNASGGVDLGGRKVPLRLFVEDSGDRLEKTLSAMGRLVRQNNISALIGPNYSREAIPVGAAMENFQVPMISPTASNPLVTRSRRYCFRICQLDLDQGRMLAMHAYENMGLRRVGILYDESDSYSSGMAETFNQAFGSRPGAEVHMETYATGAGNVLPQLERLRAAGAQALLLPNQNAELSGQVQQARAAGFSGVFIGGDTWDTDQGFHALPEAQGAVYSSDFTPVAADRKLLEASLALTARARAQLDKSTALTLDAFEFLLAAVRRAGSTEPEALRAAMTGLRGFEGLSGPIAFDSDGDSGGDPARSGFLMSIIGGEPRMVARMGTQRRKE
jgi:branched-chain amino acid transport system substrate-binding protein